MQLLILIVTSKQSTDLILVPLLTSLAFLVFWPVREWGKVVWEKPRSAWTGSKRGEKKEPVAILSLMASLSLTSNYRDPNDDLYRQRATLRPMETDGVRGQDCRLIIDLEDNDGSRFEGKCVRRESRLRRSWV